MVYDRMRTGTLLLINIVCAHEVFMATSFIYNRLSLFRIGDMLGKGPNNPDVNLFKMVVKMYIWYTYDVHRTLNIGGGGGGAKWH